MNSNFASGNLPERPEIDMLDGLRLEYVSSVLRFFADVSDLRFTGEFVDCEEYSRIIVLVNGVKRTEDIDEAIAQLTDESPEKILIEDESSKVACYQFSIGEEGLETNFVLVCSDELPDTCPVTDFYSI